MGVEEDKAIYKTLMQVKEGTKSESPLKEGMDFLVTNQKFSTSMQKAAEALRNVSNENGLEEVDRILADVIKNVKEAHVKNAEDINDQKESLCLYTLQRMTMHLSQWKLKQADPNQPELENNYVPLIVRDLEKLKEDAEKVPGVNASHLCQSCYQHKEFKLNWDKGTIRYNFLDQDVLDKEKEWFYYLHPELKKQDEEIKEEGKEIDPNPGPGPEPVNDEPPGPGDPQGRITINDANLRISLKIMQNIQNQMAQEGYQVNNLSDIFAGGENYEVASKKIGEMLHITDQKRIYDAVCKVQLDVGRAMSNLYAEHAKRQAQLRAQEQNMERSA